MTDQIPSTLLYSGRKYFWQSKSNVHLHIIQHNLVIEIIGFETELSVEAPHLFVSVTIARNKISSEALSTKLEEIRKHLQKNKKKIPDEDVLKTCVLMGMLNAYLIDNILVITDGGFHILLKEETSALPPILGNDDSTQTLATTRPADFVDTPVKRLGKSSNMIGTISESRVVELPPASNEIVLTAMQDVSRADASAKARDGRRAGIRNTSNLFRAALPAAGRGKKSD